MNRVIYFFCLFLGIHVLNATDNKLDILNNIETLLEQLKQDPDNEKIIFDIAQLYKEAENYDEAIIWYQKRIDKKKKDRDEEWLSKFMLGKCYAIKKNWPAAQQYYLEAYESNQSRAEPLYEIAKYYRIEGKNFLAYLFASLGKINSSQEISNNLDEEISIVAYYTPFKYQGFEALDRLLLNKKTSETTKKRGYLNSLFYVENLENAEFKSLAISLPRIDDNLEYKAMNPSIISTDFGYLLICRTVNFIRSSFKTIDGSKLLNTKNILVYYDKNFNVLNQYEIVENTNRQKFPHWWVSGLEDCRIFKWESDYWFTCTIWDSNPKGIHKISLCHLSNTPEKDEIKVDKVIPLTTENKLWPEKNWLPFIINNQLNLIYWFDPFLVYKPNIETGICEIVKKYQPKSDFSKFRGSAAPIKFDDGYLMMVHEVITKNRKFFYTHRFLYLNNDFEVTKVSKPFTFKHNGIEFCCAMTVDHEGKKLVMPIGIEDNEAWICFVDLDYVRSLLRILN